MKPYYDDGGVTICEVAASRLSQQALDLSGGAA